jgi:hypothetical protein
MINNIKFGIIAWQQLGNGCLDIIQLRFNMSSIGLSNQFVTYGYVYMVLRMLMVYAGGGLVRELDRWYVRTSPLGRDDDPSALIGKSPYV